MDSLDELPRKLHIPIEKIVYKQQAQNILCNTYAFKKICHICPITLFHSSVFFFIIKKFDFHCILFEQVLLSYSSFHIRNHTILGSLQCVLIYYCTAYIERKRNQAFLVDELLHTTTVRASKQESQQRPRSHNATYSERA